MAAGLALTSDLSFGSAIVIAPTTSVAAIANVILFIAFLLVVSLSAGGVENRSPQRLKISASRAFGWMGLSNVIAEQQRSALPSTSTDEWRENMSR
jgi:hypothetical protein